MPVIVTLLAIGCSDGSQLSGSVGELFSLQVSRMEILRNDEALQLSYFNNRGADVDVVARISIALKDVELKPGTRIDLQGEYEPGHARTTVVHAPGGEPTRLLPPVHKGDLYVSSGGSPGEATSGDFSMLFEDSGGDLGYGRTLAGTFSGTAVDAGFGPLP